MIPESQPPRITIWDPFPGSTAKLGRISSRDLRGRKELKCGFEGFTPPRWSDLALVLEGADASTVGMERRG